MRTTHILLLATAVVAAATFFVLSTDKTDKQETAYERVMQTGVLRCGYAVAPPFFQRDPVSGTFSGINYDLIMALAKTLKLEVAWVEETGWGSFITGLNANRFDAFCTTVWPDEGRIKNSTLTAPIFYSSAVVAVRANDSRFDHNLKVLNAPQFKVVTMDGDVTDGLREEFFPLTQRHALGQDTAVAAQMLVEVATGKADATFAFSGMIEDFDRLNPGQVKQVPGTKAVKIFPEMLSFKTGEVKLAEAFNQARQALYDSGELDKMISRYGTSIYTSHPER